VDGRVGGGGEMSIFESLGFDELIKRVVALEERLEHHKHGWSPRLPDDPPLVAYHIGDRTTVFTSSQWVGDRPMTDDIRSDIESIREDIKAILDRLERLEL
jgi:hypothetical protein